MLLHSLAVKNKRKDMSDLQIASSSYRSLGIVEFAQTPAIATVRPLDLRSTIAAMDSAITSGVSATQTNEQIDRLIKQDPEAAVVQLQEQAVAIQSDVKRNIQTLRSLDWSGQERSVRGKSSLSSMPFIDEFEKALIERDDVTNSDGELVANYLDYYNSLNDFLVKMQELAGTGMVGDDKLVMKGEDMLKLIFDFMRKWEGKALAGPLSKSEADDMMKRFKAGTVEMRGDGSGGIVTDVYLYPSYASFKKLAASITPDGRARVMIEGFMSSWGAKPPSWDEFRVSPEGSYVCEHFSTDGYASQMQAFNLSLDDIRKTHSTDMQFTTEYYSRSVTQFDSFLKLLSTLIQSLAETCKAYL
jgi:hypothetical protein